MDQTTHDIRHATWQEIVKQCRQRPEGITIKQWCRDNDISEKSYYYWQRKFRREAAEQRAVLDGIPDPCSVTFAELSYPCHAGSSETSAADTFPMGQPTAVIKNSRLTVAVTNDISDTLLLRIIREVSHA